MRARAEHDPESEHLSRIVDVMNERFGLELGDGDQLLFDQFEESWAADESLAARARNNDFQNFRLVFDRTFLDTVVKRMDENEDIFKRILDEPDFGRPCSTTTPSGSMGGSAPSTISSD